MAAVSTVAVVGASGFIGEAVLRAVEGRGLRVQAIRAPRLTCTATDAVAIRQEAHRLLEDGHLGLDGQLQGVDVIVNAAGDPDASSMDVATLTGANALLPAVLMSVAARCAVRRFVQVSSAAVQGTAAVMEESDERRPFSAYSLSKSLGEELLAGLADEAPDGPELVVYRPPGVHSAERRVSRKIAQIARSPLSTVAGDGSAPTPQALVGNVADAVVFLTVAAEPPRYVMHPWEGLTSRDLLVLLGQGKRPRHLPPSLARAVLVVGALIGRLVPRLRADVRRIEMLWFGQRQARSWLEDAGWTPPAGRDGWRRLGEQV